MPRPHTPQLKAFFRSRSRPPDPATVDPHTHPHAHPRHARKDSSSDIPPSSYYKSPVRSQNRPISSMTTATHSTITPLPSDSFANRGRLAYAFHPHTTDTNMSLQDLGQSSATCDYDSDDLHCPRSETPSSTKRKLALYSLFGFSLSRRPSASTPTPERKGSTSTFSSEPRANSSRKRSFRLTSRPATSKSVDDPSSSKSPYSIPIPSSPLPLSASPRRRSFGLGSSQRTTPKSSTGNLPLPQSPQAGRSHARRQSVGSEHPPHDNPSPISRNHISSQSPARPVFSHLPTVDSASSEENEKPSLLAPHPLPVIPQIVHTPPTPQRPGGDIDFPSASSTPQLGGRFTPRFLSGKDMLQPTGNDAQKSSRQPAAGSSDGLAHKTPASNTTGPARNMTSHRGKLGSFDFERPVSALNKSSSTVDRQGTHVPTDNSSYSKAQLHSLERTISEDSARDGKSRHHPGQAETPILSQLQPDHTGDTSVISFSSLSLQTKSTGKGIGGNTQAGQSSSWGRASGRHILRTSHGTFAFEHPSSAPNSPDPRPFNLPNDQNQNDLPKHSGLPKSLPSTPLHAIFDARVKHSRGRSFNTSDHIEPGYSNPSEPKPKGKGRSLDLGLGLSWAPSRLREEVLMPGLILAREKAKLGKDRENGSDVTKMFESLLSESRFQTFKKYVRRFDAHVIPLEGPSGLLARVEKLVAESGLTELERNKLMSEFTVFVESHNG
ncbi:hypothetical protein HD554DRAFT_2010511 [Boletus coccyginus]|nr:hypothetical protein HD554DRAFT_2010511 [Boletus coccyginus]